jgi:hypothetical protein
MAGLCQFEATPPHAELLGQIARSPWQARRSWPVSGGTTQDTDARRLLTRQAWSALRKLPASAYLGLVTLVPLRMPYGKPRIRSIPSPSKIHPPKRAIRNALDSPVFLDCHPGRETYRRNGKSMQLGSIATIGDLPVYIYRDADGGQIRCPAPSSSDRRQAVQVAGTGANPVPQLRSGRSPCGWFQVLVRPDLAGPWAPSDKISATSEPDIHITCDSEQKFNRILPSGYCTGGDRRRRLDSLLTDLGE